MPCWKRLKNKLRKKIIGGSKRRVAKRYLGIPVIGKRQVLLCCRAVTIVFSFGLAEIVAQRNLVKASAIKTDIARLVRVVIRNHKIVDIGTDYGRK